MISWSVSKLGVKSAIGFGDQKGCQVIFAMIFFGVVNFVELCGFFLVGL